MIIGVLVMDEVATECLLRSFLCSFLFSLFDMVLKVLHADHVDFMVAGAAQENPRLPQVFRVDDDSTDSVVGILSRLDIQGFAALEQSDTLGLVHVDSLCPIFSFDVIDLDAAEDVDSDEAIYVDFDRGEVFHLPLLEFEGEHVFANRGINHLFRRPERLLGAVIDIDDV